MKRKKIVIFITMVCMFFFVFTGVDLSQFKEINYKESDMDVLHTSSMKSSNYCEEHIVVAVNSDERDREKIKKEILKRCVANNFHSIRFSKRFSEIDKLYVDVYVDKEAYSVGDKMFRFEFPE